MRRATRTAVKSTESAAPFDLSKVKTTADSPVRKGNRIFGLQEAPTFYPTKQEFQDPLAYIEKISPEGEKYGIIKIVPPKDYHPEFSLKTENFRFRTRIQKLNSMEGETRTNVNYLEQLTKYHIQNGRTVSKIPQLDKRPIDLYKLKNEVALRGGVQEVTRLKKWAEIGRILGYTRKQCTSLSNSLKTAYVKWVLPYEIWYAKHKDDVDQVLRNQSAVESDTCEICQRVENQDQLLLCDGCNRGYHMYCLKPPLSSVPKNEWYCLQCLTAVGKDYGFEDGDEYSLEEFRQFSDKFKKEWFKNNENPVTEEECENEFWRLVENPHEKCQVEYGADLHSTQHGSGFMVAEQMPQGEFDPWNLNVIPVAPQSLFTHIKTDISGMMVPWLYVGMCFSAFCWHNEDHYTFSINYMHWGETKTWYGVPGSDTAKFEETMKKAVPELFEQQPDLLFQLVTMLSPGRLLQENVNVYAVDQRPGQFVVTYPKAYHSGFNHGFNFCEAVNFAPGDWVDYGLECVKLYKAFKKQPCFSHDELLITAAQRIESTEDVDWLKRGLEEMQTRELKERKLVRSRKLKEELVSENKLVEELQCDHCHCYTYLSYIGCKCTDKVVCHEHISELCTCDISAKTMYLRFTDQQLKDITRRIFDLGASPEKWIKKLDDAMTSRPTMKTMKDLLKEGREINAPQDSLDTLKDCIETVDQWNAEAEKATNLKYDVFRNGKRRYQKINELIERASSIGFDETLYLDKVNEYKAKIDALDRKITDTLLASNDAKLQMELYEEGLQLRADSPRFLQLMALVESSSWDDRVQKSFNSPFNLKNIRKLIKNAEDMGMDSDSGVLFNQLTRIEEFGKQVLARIDHICRGREKITVDDEKNIVETICSNGELSIILDPQTITRLKNNLARSKETLEEIEDAMAVTHSSVEARLSVAEAQRLLSLSREISFTSPAILELSNELAKAAAWNDQVRHTFMNGRQKSLETTLKEVLANVERITSSDKKSNIWCVCRQPESGLMVECDLCREWYHNTCLKVARNAVRSSNSYICPICSPSENDKKMTYVSRQPKAEEIESLVEKAQELRFCPKEYVLIRDIYSVIREYRDRVQAFCRSRAQLGMQDVSKIKDYLRELTGLEVLLQDESDFLKSKIQALVPVNQTSNDIACVCQNMDNKIDLIVCSECQRWSHAACVQHHGEQFICSSCSTGSMKNKNGKRAAEDQPLTPPPKPNKIIKLTVKPPVFDGGRKHDTVWKKQKSVA